MLTEHEAFLKLTEDLAKASDSARQIAFFRPDQARQWNMIADMLTQTKDQAYALAMQKVN